MSEDRMSNDFQDRIDGIAGSLHEECEIVIIAVVREAADGSADVKIASRGNIFELFGVAATAKERFKRICSGDEWEG